MNPKVKKKKNKKSKKLKLFFKIILIIFSFLVILFFLFTSTIFAYEKIYDNKIYPGIFLAGHKISGLTQKEAIILLKKSFDNYKEKNIGLIDVKKEWYPKTNELGFEPLFEKSIAKSYYQCRSGNFWQDLKEKFFCLVQKKNLSLEYKLDKQKFDNYLNKVSQEVDKPAIDANLIFEGTNLKLIKPQKGLIIDREKLENRIINSLILLQKNNFSLPFKNDEPKIKEEGTRDARQEAELAVSQPINFFYGDINYKVEPNQIASWINFVPAFKEIGSYENNNSLNINVKKEWYLKFTLNEDKIREFLLNIANEQNIEPKPTKVTFSNNQKFVLEEGYDGRSLDFDKMITEIKNKIKEKGERNIELAFKIVPAGEIEATEYGIIPITNEKYIDVSLSKQVLTCFDGGKAQFMTLISSGISKYPTPTGTFHIYSKTPSTRMRYEYGPNHPDNYDLPNVPYAMFFSGPYSIHGTYWHNNFGIPMSHGCVNTPTPAAEWIYNWAPIGTMVYIHW